MKEKITVTMKPETLVVVDNLRGDLSRSFVVDRAVQLGLQQIRQDPGLILRGP
jgi:hypothetical protein